MQVKSMSCISLKNKKKIREKEDERKNFPEARFTNNLLEVTICSKSTPGVHAPPENLGGCFT